MTDAIQFKQEDGSLVSLYVLEETKLGGMTYLLAADSQEGDANAVILKDVSAEGDMEACLVEVEDEKELDAVSRIFAELLGDVEFQ
jgi:indole-3-glycerol phosphate synthase